MGSEMGRIRIILPDPDPGRYQFQANYSIKLMFFLESFNRRTENTGILNTENYDIFDTNEQDKTL
jgi:hypothetical protein